MIPKLNYLWVMIGFVGCTHKTDTYNFETINTVKMDESKVVLSRYPSQVEAINDSIIAAVNSYQTVSLYNIYSGKNTLNFSTRTVNFDSLTKYTYQKKYEGTRKYIYDSSSEGLSGEGGQVKSFQYADNTFYILISTMAEVSYVNDSSALATYSENEKVKQLKKKYGAVNMRVMDYMNFLFVTDDQFNLKKIIPLYESKNLKNSHYFPIYERAFLANKNHIYVYLSKDNEAYTTMRSKKQLQDLYIAKINIQDSEKTECFVGKANIDFAGFTIHDYYAAPIKLSLDDNELIYANSREVCEVESGKKIFSAKNLLSNESIASCYIDSKKQIIMVNYLTDSKNNPTEFDIQYALDSLHSLAVKVFDMKTQKWLSEKKLPSAVHLPFSVSR
nr:hypothetical protein [Bacteroidota bacterium]